MTFQTKAPSQLLRSLRLLSYMNFKLKLEKFLHVYMFETSNKQYQS